MPRDLAHPLVGRGIAYADIDADGDLDLLITQNGRRPALLRNDQQTGHHWLRVELIGRPPNTNAIGARLELTAGGVTGTADPSDVAAICPRWSCRSPSVSGDSDRVDRINIQWPDGRAAIVVPDGVDQLAGHSTGIGSTS